MDTLEKWHAYIADVHTLFRYWEKERAAGRANRKRVREILTICLFTLCLENNENKRFLIGFQQRGKPPSEGGPVQDLFKDGFAEIENVDVILVPDLGPDGPSEREIHRCQMVGYRDRPNPSTEDLIEFLEEKKLRFSAPDNDLRLIVHLEQAIAWDWVPLSAHLQLRRPPPPFSQIFVLAQTSLNPSEPNWSCRQIFPRMLSLRDLNLEMARRVLADRKFVCPFVPNVRDHDVNGTA
ncbi:MAG TPA: hypothetical protein VGG02_13935 [Chthoniobacterales bacterium]|jgi:hypothetical protein